MKKINKILIIICIGMILSSSALAATQKVGTYPGDSFIDPSATIDVKSLSIGKESYVAPFTIFRGDSLYIGNYSNVQDSGYNRGNITISDYVVIAHGVDLSDNVKVEDGVFIGFNSIVQGAIIGKGAYINIGSKIIGVEIPAGKATVPGAIIDSQKEADELPNVTQEQVDFVKEVVEINRVFAIGYSKLFDKSGLTTFQYASPNGDGDILIDGKDILTRKGSEWPVIGNGTIVQNTRVIGDVVIGKGGNVGNRTSIRSDEGVPITIGDNAQIGEDNTFHSLNNEEIKIGNNFRLQNDAVMHGPLTIGDNVLIGSRAVVFKSKIGNDVDIGDKAIIIGVEIPDGMIVPPEHVLTDQKTVDKIARMLNSPERTEGPMTTIAPAKDTPGFEGIIVMIGLLSMMYFLKRR